ncbi:MAG: D-amino acid aminotransferase [Clostridia bacterium]|nr:D-amino acid aminotransferase [Clostridia bacterium]
MVVFLNGRFVPYAEAVVSVEDRGLLFADAVYEVVKCYGGRPFRLETHLTRLQRSADAIRLPLPLAPEEWAQVVAELVRRNGLEGVDASVYLQVTRGPAPRAHAFPDAPRPTVFAVARALPPADPVLVERGVAVITVPDPRWHLCHVKATGLLANVLAKEQAREAGAYDALFVRDGAVTEATSANVFFVRGGVLWTHPEGPAILSGVTREVILELARERGVPVREEPVPPAEAAAADECFLSGTITEVLPVTRIDGRPVGDGTPGPVTRTLRQALLALARGRTAAVAPADGANAAGDGGRPSA